MESGKKIAILGGSFNPVHLGHLFLAEEVASMFSYDKILFIPAFEPPHKQLASGASTEDRVAMLSAAIANNPLFAMDLCEVERGGVSYTIDTVLHLKDTYHGAKIGLIIGDDLVDGFSTWKSADDLSEKTEIILARRLADGLGPVFGYPHQTLENTIFPVSSTLIRERIRSKKPFRYLVPAEVYEYIEQSNLYGYKSV